MKRLSKHDKKQIMDLLIFKKRLKEHMKNESEKQIFW